MVHRSSPHRWANSHRGRQLIPRTLAAHPPVHLQRGQRHRGVPRLCYHRSNKPRPAQFETTSDARPYRHLCAPCERSRHAVQNESPMCVVLSRCFRVGWTGLGWATPCWWQAPMRSHRPGRGAGGVDRSIRGQHHQGASAGYRVRPHPDFIWTQSSLSTR